ASRIAELLDRMAEISKTERVRILTYGHAGDGNLHVNFLWNEEEEMVLVHRAIERLFREVLQMEGTISGEHGIGVLKAPYLGMELSPAMIGLQRQVKAVFDPEGLMNPGKIFEEG
ncbi:MAG: FAD-linked oxidase, partial [Sorangium cellulosum]